MPAPTKRQFNAALKTAIADRRVSVKTDYRPIRYGNGFSADYGIHWPQQGMVALFRQRADRTFYLSYAEPAHPDSPMGRSMVEWDINVPQYA